MTDSGSTIGTIVSTGGFSSTYPYGSIDISTHNLLPLEAWRAEMSYHPWHFWQLSDTNFTPVPAAKAPIALDILRLKVLPRPVTILEAASDNTKAMV